MLMAWLVLGTLLLIALFLNLTRSLEAEQAGKKTGIKRSKVQSNTPVRLATSRPAALMLQAQLPIAEKDSLRLLLG